MPGNNNVASAARAVGIDKIVFSSTCATYGIPLSVPMNETHPQLPINPYGRSKLIIEQILKDLDLYQGFRSCILRYFNAAGADLEGRIGNGIARKLTPYLSPSKSLWVNAPSSKCSGATMTRATGPACRPHTMSSTSQMPIPGRKRDLLGDGVSHALNLGTGARDDSEEEMLRRYSTSLKAGASG